MYSIMKYCMHNALNLGKYKTLKKTRMKILRLKKLKKRKH